MSIDLRYLWHPTHPFRTVFETNVPAKASIARWLVIQTFPKSNRLAPPGSTPRHLPTTPQRGPRAAAARSTRNPCCHRRSRRPRSPRLLASHLSALARFALEDLSGGAVPMHQFDLVDQLLGLHKDQTNRTSSTSDLLQPSNQIASEILASGLSHGQAATIRPLKPLGRQHSAGGRQQRTVCGSGLDPRKHLCPAARPALRLHQPERPAPAPAGPHKGSASPAPPAPQGLSGIQGY